MLTLSKKSDYALIIVSQLVGKKKYVPLSELIENTDLPRRFLARISATLVSNNLLVSREGRVGGYVLSPNIESISLYDFLRIFETNMDFLTCLNSKKAKCKYKKICRHKEGIRTKLNDVVLQQLKKTRLIDLL
jgi:Rrf2 family protein